MPLSGSFRLHSRLPAFPRLQTLLRQEVRPMPEIVANHTEPDALFKRFDPPPTKYPRYKTTKGRWFFTMRDRARVGAAVCPSGADPDPGAGLPPCVTGLLRPSASGGAARPPLSGGFRSPEVSHAGLVVVGGVLGGGSGCGVGSSPECRGDRSGAVAGGSPSKTRRIRRPGRRFTLRGKIGSRQAGLPERALTAIGVYVIGCTLGWALVSVWIAGFLS